MSDNPIINRPPAIRPIVPATLDEAWRLATAIDKSRMAPSGYNSPEQITVAILHGLELGMTPMAALQSISVINGRPTIWGDGMVAIVRASGLCSYIKESFNGEEGDKFAAVCETRRTGEDEPVTVTFSVGDAKKANLWGKKGPWTDYPKRMMAARARSWCLRDTYADVLRGLTAREEVEDFHQPPMRDVTPEHTEPRQTRRAPDPDAETVEPENRADEPPVADEVPFDPDAVLAELEEALALATTPEDVWMMWGELDLDAGLTHHPDSLAMALMMRDRRIKKLGKAKP